MHVGSRPWHIDRLTPGESIVLEAPKGKLANFMSQVGVDIRRLGHSNATFTMSHILAIDMRDKSVVDIVRITRKD